MVFLEIQSYIEAAENDLSRYEERCFDKRIEVMDFLEFQVIGQLEELLRSADDADRLLLLKSRAEKVRLGLEEINSRLFRQTRASIRTGEYTGDAFRALVAGYVDVGRDCSGRPGEPGYDTLDVFTNGLIYFPAIPEQTRDLEPEMVYYQKTPARVVFELVEKADFGKEDVFFDLGSGLGQVAILVNLLAGIRTRGVEIEPAFCDYAREMVAELNLSGVTFVPGDARAVDYSEGTTFFLYTPFGGEVLQAVLATLRKEAALRKIKVFTYGPCTERVASESWLEVMSTGSNTMYTLGVFCSL